MYGGGSGGLEIIPHVPTYVQYGIFFIGFVLVTFSPTVYGGGSGGLEKSHTYLHIFNMVFLHWVCVCDFQPDSVRWW